MATSCQTASRRNSPPVSTGRSRRTAAARATDRSTAEASAKPADTSSPNGVAIWKPAFGPPRMMPGVASAWSDRNPAALRNDSETR